MADMQLINACKDGIGASVYATNNGVIELEGTTVFANNHADGGTNAWRGGGGDVRRRLEPRMDGKCVVYQQQGRYL